jgi:hypothetical protein
MTSLRTLTIIAAGATLGLLGCAQTPVGAGTPPQYNSTATSSGAMPTGEPGSAMAKMDEHIRLMREVHHRIMVAKTPQERSAVMAEHMQLMKDGMSMMSGMEKGGMGPGAKETMKDMGPMDGEHAKRHAYMEKKMEMMQEMTATMMDSMSTAPAAP